MSRRLRKTVYVAGRVYLAGGVPPDDVAAQITNPAAWEPETASEAAERDRAAAATGAARRSAAETLAVLQKAAAGARQENEDLGEATSQVTAGESPQEPPRKGRGSGLEVWLAYAEQLGIEVSDDASRDDVIALVDAHR